MTAVITWFLVCRDGVFTGRGLTHHTNQMNLKLEKFLTAAMAIALAASTVVAEPLKDHQSCRTDGFGGWSCNGRLSDLKH